MDTIQLLAIAKKQIEILDAKKRLTGEELSKHNELCRAYNMLQMLGNE